jgi:glycosyltransferase involved in cell wall biosynthesis
LKSEVTYAAERFLISRASLVAVSKDIEKSLKDRYPKAVIRNIYNGVPPLPTELPERDEVRGRFGVPDDAPWIVSAARLEPVKNISLLLAAVEILKNQGVTGFRVGIFGEGPEKRNLEEEANRRGLNEEVTLHGFFDPILAVLAASDIFTLTSRHEGLPMALLEAMACGSVPVCSEVGGIAEVVSTDQDGILIPPGDAAALASGLMQLIENEEKRRSLAGRAKITIRERFDVARSNDELLAFYESVLRGTPVEASP